jgi:putative copper export protein
MRFRPARLYTWIASIGLLLQGTSTLAARLVPAIDQAFPALLEQTKMIPSHSVLHIATALIGFATLRSPADRAPTVFALGFGLFYVGLAVLGHGSGHHMGIGLQPFDHSFHFVLGLVGIVAGAISYLRTEPAARSVEP